MTFKFTVSLCMLMLLGACSKPADHDTTIYLVRHFEKQVPLSSQNKDVSLTSVGQSKAQALAKHLQNSGIEEVYSTDYRRTIQTASPTSDMLRVDINLYDPRDLQALVDSIRLDKTNKLIVGHSNTTGVVFGLLGCEAVSLQESDYSDVFVVRFSKDTLGKPVECSRYTLPFEAPKIPNYVLVPQAALSKYWEASNTHYVIEDAMLVNPNKPGTVEVGFTINRNGKVDNVEILTSTPSNLWDEHAILAAKQLVFEPVGEQVYQATIYTTWTFRFTP